MKRVLVVALLIFILAGCQQPTPTAPPPTPTASIVRPTETAASVTETPAPATETPVATVDATQIFAAAETAVVQTQEAAPTETAAVATATVIPWTLTPTAQTGCEVPLVSPKTTDPALAVDAPFDGRLTVKNTGTKDWLNTQTDIRYISGEKFQTKGDVFDLATTVASGGSFDEIIDMKAPTKAGTYSARWGIYNAGSLVCSLDLSVTVK